jgi:tetratricopeptide (TPR) repeat protein
MLQFQFFEQNTIGRSQFMIVRPMTGAETDTATAHSLPSSTEAGQGNSVGQWKPADPEVLSRVGESLLEVDPVKAEEYFGLAMTQSATELLLKQQRRLNSLPPGPTTIFSKADVIDQWRDPQHFAVAELQGYRASRVASLVDLAPIALRETQVPFRHLGRRLLCRTITQFVAEVVTVVEDVNNDHIVLCFYSFSNADLNDSIPVGTVLVVKEPSLKFSYDSIPFVDVKSPSDVVILHASNAQFLLGPPFHKPCALSFDARKLRGNVYFRAGNYQTALVFYDLALDIEPDNPQIRLKKARALARMGRHFEAYQIASSVSRLRLRDIPVGFGGGTLSRTCASHRKRRRAAAGRAATA